MSAPKVISNLLPQAFQKALNQRVTDMGMHDASKGEFGKMVTSAVKVPSKSEKKTGLSEALSSYEEEAMKATLGQGDLNTLVQATTNAEATLRTVRTLVSEAIKVVKEVHQTPV